MSRAFEELDRQPTPMGDIVLRRRLDPALHVDVFEVKLGDDYLMSSLFTAAERALAELTLARLPGDVDVVVGGLGLGYTAHAALAHERVASLTVVEMLDAVISWHERHLVPLAPALTADTRCTFVAGDFFELIAEGGPLGAVGTGRCHALLVDIDHSPRHLLDPRHAGFYSPPGLQRVADRLHRGGVFGLWADGAPDPEFIDVLDAAFAASTAQSVAFPNPLTGGESSSTVYVATTA